MKPRKAQTVGRLAAGLAAAVVASAMLGGPVSAQDAGGASAAPNEASSTTPTEEPSAPSSGDPTTDPTNSPSEGASETPTDGPPGTTAPPTPTDTPSGPSESPSGGPESPSPTPTPDGADLAVTAPGNKVTVGSKGKSVRVDVDNYGPKRADDVEVTLRIAEETDAAAIELPGEGQACDRSSDGSESVCTYPDLDAGDVDTFVTFHVTPTSDTEGYAGRVTIEATSATKDPKLANNTAEVDIELVGRGADLTAFAAQVGPLRPGKSVALLHGFVNQGSEAAPGWSITIRLPEHSAIVERYDGCKYRDNGREMFCVVPERVEPNEGWDLTGTVTVRIGKGAPAPVVLGRGAVTVMPLEEEVSILSAKGEGSFAAAVANRGGASARTFGGGEMVEGDNTVTFAVKTKQAPAGGPDPSTGPSTRPSADPAPGGGGGALPVTGTGLLGLLGGGAMATVLGGAIYLIARRRRAAAAAAAPDDTMAM